MAAVIERSRLRLFFWLTVLLVAYSEKHGAKVTIPASLASVVLRRWPNLDPNPDPEEPMYHPNELENRSLALRLAVDHCRDREGADPVSVAQRFYDFLAGLPVTSALDDVVTAAARFAAS